MSATGYIQVHAYSSFAEVPLKGVAIAVTATDGTALALRLTDRSGFVEPIPIPTPDRSESQEPNPGEKPFAVVNLYAALREYVPISIENLQMFPGTTTVQDLQLIPLSEVPNARDESETFDTLPQNL